MSKLFSALLIGLFSAGLSSGTALAQNAKKDSQSDARTKKCATLTGTERTTCLEQARKQPDPNGSFCKATFEVCRKSFQAQSHA